MAHGKMKEKEARGKFRQVLLMYNTISATISNTVAKNDHTTISMLLLPLLLQLFLLLLLSPHR